MIEKDNEEKNKKKIAVYIRVSWEEQIDLYWPDNQREKIFNYINVRSEHWEIPTEDDIYFDGWISWTLEIEKRPALKSLFDKIEYSISDQKPYDMILVYKIDRFARRLTVLLEIVEKLKLYSIWFASVTESIDTDTPFGNAMLGILWVFAELERSLIEERTSWGREQALKDDKWMNDKYWFKRVENDPYIIPEEARVVGIIYDLFVNKRLSVSEIMKELRAQKIPIPTVTKTQKRKKETMDRTVNDIYKWWDKTIRTILTDEVYIGRYYYWKTKTIKDPKKWTIQIKVPKEEWQTTGTLFPAIIDEDLFYRAQELFQNKTWGIWRKENSDYILSWLLRCCACQHLRRDNKPLQIKWLPWGWVKSYVCNGKNSQKFEWRRCTVIPIPKEELEEFVIDHIKNFFGEPKHFERFVQDHKSNGASKKIINDQKEVFLLQYNKTTISLKNIDQQYDDWEIDKTSRDQKRNVKMIERAELEAKIANLNRTLKEQADIEKYKEWMWLIKDMIWKNLDKLFENRALLQRFLHYLISDIFVYSRDATEKDRLTGRKKIPYAIDIQMRLPQEIIQSLYEETKSNHEITEVIDAPSDPSKRPEIVKDEEIDEWEDEEIDDEIDINDDEWETLYYHKG